MNAWQREAERLVAGMGCSDACAHEIARGVIAHRARKRGLPPIQFAETLRWLYGHLSGIEDRVLRSMEAEPKRVFQALQWEEDPSVHSDLHAAVTDAIYRAEKHDAEGMALWKAVQVAEMAIVTSSDPSITAQEKEIAKRGVVHAARRICVLERL